MIFDLCVVWSEHCTGSDRVPLPSCTTRSVAQQSAQQSEARLPLARDTLSKGLGEGDPRETAGDKKGRTNRIAQCSLADASEA